MKTDHRLPIEAMLRDADRAWEYRELGPTKGLLGDMACHVRALAEENARLRRALAVPADRESEDLREALRSEMIVLGGKAYEENGALRHEVDRLRKLDATRVAACKAILGRLRGRKGTDGEGRLSIADTVALKTIAGEWETSEEADR